MADFKPASELGARKKTDYVAKVHIDEGGNDPTATDDYDAGFGYGALWINVSGGRAYICLDPNPASAVWVQIN